MTKYGLRKYIKVLPLLSEDASKIFEPKINLLFIDGNHEYESVKRLRTLERFNSFRRDYRFA